MDRRHTFVLAALLVVSPAVRADYYIVVRADNPQPAITQRQALDLYMGGSRVLFNGDFAVVFDLPRDDPQRASFYKALTGLSPAQVNSHWARLMFSGQRMPPQALPDESAMVGMVKRNPSALGWLSAEPSDKSLRTVLVIKDKQ